MTDGIGAPSTVHPRRHGSNRTRLKGTFPLSDQQKPTDGQITLPDGWNFVDLINSLTH